MRLPALCTVLFVPALAFANDGSQSVIGGGAAPAGRWPDTVAVMWGTNAANDTACTGTLIAPNLVVTAGHCVIGGAPDHVLVGASKLSQPQDGKTIAIQKAIEYPDSQNS